MALSLIKPSLAKGSWKPQGCWLWGPLPTTAHCLCPCPIQHQQRVVTHWVGRGQLALASASAGRQMANTPCQCWEGLGCGWPGEHCGSALLRNLLWLLSFFQREASTWGGGRHGEAVSLRANLQWDLRQVVHKVPRWTLRVKGSANYSQGRPSGQVPSPTGAGCLTCLSLGFLLCQQPTCLPQALTPPPTEPLALQALEPHMAPAAQHGAFSSQFAQVAGQASPP